MKIDKSWVAFKKKTNALPIEIRESLLNLLSIEGYQAYQEQPSPSVDPLSDLTIEEMINKIDFSWFEQRLKEFSEKDQNFFLSAMPNQRPPKGYELDEKLKNFALSTLFNETFDLEDRPLPLSFLPEDPLNPLTTASGNDLIKLCQFLGLFDVARELKQVIKAKALKKIEEAFTKDEISFIHQIKDFKKQVQFIEIGLKGFNDEIELLKEVVFGRGLNRLAKALSRSAPSLIWYITHFLPKKDAIGFRKLMVEVKNETTFNDLVEQVIYTWDHICTLSP